MQPRFQGYMGAGRTDFWSGTQSALGLAFGMTLTGLLATAKF